MNPVGVTRMVLRTRVGTSGTAEVPIFLPKTFVTYRISATFASEGPVVPMLIFIIMMRRILLLLLMAASLTVMAQKPANFKGRMVNDEYQVYINIDFYRQWIIVPGQEILGQLAGYLGDERDGRKWLFTEAKVETDTKATIAVINDYGSEDLTATLTVNPGGTYTLRQEKGSVLKIARNRKWVKLPKSLVFHR